MIANKCKYLAIELSGIGVYDDGVNHLASIEDKEIQLVAYENCGWTVCVPEEEVRDVIKVIEEYSNDIRGGSFPIRPYLFRCRNASLGDVMKHVERAYEHEVNGETFSIGGIEIPVSCYIDYDSSLAIVTYSTYC